MTKYKSYIYNFGDNDLNSDHIGSEQAYQLLNIANELAEMNRLKRLELSKPDFRKYNHTVIEDEA